MPQKIVPMLHVPDVSAAVDWYTSIGFRVSDVGNLSGELVWALLTYGNSELLLDEGGKPSDEPRREVDLYIYVDNVDEVFQRLDGKVELVKELNDTFYGMREFIIRDCNRFWLTFAQPLQK
jgi:uncharacterized glyoxalase superfamily protein PhnB